MLQGWKMRNMNLRHQLARVDFARHENARNAIVWNTECCICLSIAEQECILSCLLIAWSVKIISWLFVKLSFRLLASAHSLTLYNSAERESTLTAAIMRYVSSAYLQSAFPLQIRCVYNIRCRTDC